MSKVSNSTKIDSKSSGFFFRKGVIKAILYALYTCCAALVAIEFFIHRHTVTDIEKLHAFYPIYAVISCIVLIVVAQIARKLFSRKEDYYEKTKQENS